MERSRRRKNSSTERDSSMSAPKKKRSRKNQETSSESDENVEEDLNMEASTSQASTVVSRRRKRKLTESSRPNSCRASAASFNLSSEPSIPNSFSRCGKVISMRLTNFMCHSNLFIEFGPNINFLVGNNGSGKSAVITALALGLTSSARATNRASSIQKLIKNGETSSTIEITLCNTGLRPFKADIYGPHLSVVRNIRQSSSTYEIKDARGKSVSRKLEEIRRMLLCFGINVENPIFVLNQEASREFLKELEPASNYRLLMKATQLDVCALSLGQCHEQRRHFNQDLDLLEKKRNLIKSEVEAEEEKLSILQNKEEVKVQLEEAKIKQAWMAVTNCQKELSNLEHSMNLIEAKKSQLAKTTSKKESTQAVLTQQLSEFEASKRQIFESYKDQEGKVKAAKRTVQEELFKVSSIRANITNAERRIAEEQHAFDSCQKHIENYHSEYTKVKQQREQHANTAKALKKEVSENEDMIATLREEQMNIKRQIPVVQEQVEALKNERLQLARKKQGLQSEIDSLARNKSNKVSVYGEQSMQVVHTLRNQYSGSKQHKMPRGPIGQYISVPNPRYRDLVENQLLSCLRSYIVSSHTERISLGALLRNKYPNDKMPSIITCTFTDRVYNVSKHKVQATTPNTTVLIDEISCEDPVVMNFLIDSLRIETVLVTESKETAEFLTSESENVPPNLTRVLVPNLGLEYIPAPNYAVYSNRLAPARFIQVNVDDRIKQLHTVQLDVQEREASLEASYEQAKSKLAHTIQESNKTRSVIDQHHASNQRATQKIIDIENFEYQELPEYERLKTHLSDSREKITKFKAERDELKAKLLECNQRKAEAETEESSEASALQEIHKKMATLETESHEVESKIRSLDLHYNENSRSLQKTIEIEKKLHSQKKEMEDDLEKAREAAQQLGEFIATKQTEAQIRDKISRYKSKIKQLDNLNYSAEEVQQELYKLRESLNTQVNQYRIIESVVKKLRMAYHQRAQLFQRSRHHYFTMVQFQFEQALAMRNFHVSFETSDREKTWSISVYPPSGNQTSNTRSLSGGERSFTTVSLLKGLWSTSDHPFYFLDEYDVFTDEVNRKFITDILINEGLDCKNRQYCFLTPQDTAVKANPFITVHKLEPPEH